MLECVDPDQLPGSLTAIAEIIAYIAVSTTENIAQKAVPAREPKQSPAPVDAFSCGMRYFVTCQF